MLLCNEFLFVGFDYLDGVSDGYEYWIIFVGMNLGYIYEMVK